jgi:hypothetical protein
MHDCRAGERRKKGGFTALLKRAAGDERAVVPEQSFEPAGWLTRYDAMLDVAGGEGRLQARQNQIL